MPDSMHREYLRDEQRAISEAEKRAEGAEIERDYWMESAKEWRRRAEAALSSAGDTEEGRKS
jgi:hypothetical protein